MPEIPSLPECRSRVLSELAELRALTVQELEAELSAPGTRIDSVEAEYVIACIEVKFDVVIPQVEEIESTSELSLDVLVGHIRDGWGKDPDAAEST